jgi:guanosine-3',5'-bis(diphosphate) 3'-pyrophosphohydrolase
MDLEQDAAERKQKVSLCLLDSPDSFFEPLKSEISYLTPDDFQKVYQAFLFAFDAHSGQFRKSGEPYITHPVAVARILASLKLDAVSIMAALLHDVIEDCQVSQATLDKNFGADVGALVEGVSKISVVEFESRKAQQAENVRKMLLAMTQDVRVILVKLADRLHNMSTIIGLAPEKRRRIAKETLDIYAPIANRLGMHQMRIQFEDYGFYALYPMRSRLLDKAAQKQRQEQNPILELLKEKIETRFAQNHLPVQIQIRKRHLYSLYQKLRQQRRTFSQLMEQAGFRIIVATVDQCYRALGVVHNLFTPIPGRFKDYIAIPKSNGYQSLHTTLKGPKGQPIELQIRTHDMDQMANQGILSHWIYKQNHAKSHSMANASDPHFRTRTWFNNLLDLQQHTVNSLEFIENVKIDLFPDEVYVFSPKGHILELPRYATPVDFAYAVHTDIGNHCVACRIDGKLMPLTTRLQSGQSVEIITHPSARPSSTWLNLAITGKARANIRHFLKHQKQIDAIALGRKLLDRAVQAASATPLDSLSLEQTQNILQPSGCHTLDQLLEQIGLGTQIPEIIAKQLSDKALPIDNNKHPIIIQGTQGVAITFGTCCCPLPGDMIYGVMREGSGLTVHREECEHTSAQSHTIVQLEWATLIEENFTAILKIETENKPGVLASIAAVISEAESNIENITTPEKEAHLTQIQLTLSVRDRVHLAQIIKSLRLLPPILKIARHKT